MAMIDTFIVVGKKSNDCYVLYDKRHGGKACASLYTIKQLMDNGYGVIGVTGYSKNIKSKDITIMNMQGTPTTRISSYDEIPNTKRSASTFMKGIKRSKEEVKKAKEIGEKRSQTYQKNKKPLVPIVEVYKLQNSGGIKRLTPQMVCFLYNLFNKTNIDDFEQLQTKDNQSVPVYYSKSTGKIVSRKQIESDYQRQVDSLGLTEDGYVNYSFYSSSYSSYKTPKALAEYVLKNTDKKILYTFGLKYRGPSTCDVPISKEEAIKKWSNNNMTDIVEHPDYIDMNQYSANDMW